VTGPRSTRVLRSLGSLVAALTVLAGVPFLLATSAGWPLPTRIPSLDGVEQAARAGLSDQVIVNTLAVIAWIAWAQIALAIVAETVAVIRGRQATRLPVLPGLQITAARLVTGVVMITSTLQPVRAGAAPAPVPIVAEAPAVTIGADPDVATHHSSNRVSIPAPALATGTVDAEQPTVTVQRHDSYWAIAERTLDDGLRWREILDLNAGRILPDGTIINPGDDTLHAGWILVLPVDATRSPAPTGLPETPVTALGGDRDGVAMDTVVVERGDNLWTISEDRLEVDLGRDPTDAEVAPYWRQVIDANQDRYVRPDNPSLLHPGQTLVLPPTGHEQPPPVGAPSASSPDDEPVSTETPPAPQLPRAEHPAIVEATPAEPTPTTEPSSQTEPAPSAVEHSDRAGDIALHAELHESGESGLPVPVAVGGLSSIVLAVGLKRLIGQRRRRFTNEHAGELPGRIPHDQRDLHHAVIAQADEERIDDLQGVLGRLSATLAAAGSERRPRLIRHSDSELEVLLDQPDVNAPTGWTSTEDGTVWTLVEQSDTEELYDGPLSPSPLMVTIGQPEEDAQLYLDLEADGILALTGDSDVAANLARSILTELTLSPLADTLRVIAVGDLVDPEAKTLDHLMITDTWDGHAEDLVAWSMQSHDALIKNGWANTFVGRGHEPDHDALVPIAVVADRPPPDELAAALRAAQPSAVAVVVVGEFRDAMATVRCEDDALNFDAVDLACSPQELEADELAAISSVLIATDSPAEQELMEQLQAEIPRSVSSACHRSADNEANPLAPEKAPLAACDEPPAYDVLVRLLGDIVVEGGELLKPKATAVVSYLALHRSVTTGRLEEACWFGSDGSSHTKRIHDTMAEVRSALGSQHFPANRSGRYVAGTRVRTDLELFDWRVHQAADLPPGEAVEQYRTALDLVTGKPFSYPNVARASYGWVDFEHHATTWELRATGVAQACAEMYIDMGNPASAIAMLSKLVQTIPLSSALVESLMRAHIADDDCARAEAVYKEHAAALEQAKLGDPADSIEQLRLDLQIR
jgi:nucleoid-associated protein YgaU/DNA-binding SARP family transcriptional activator